MRYFHWWHPEMEDEFVAVESRYPYCNECGTFSLTLENARTAGVGVFICEQHAAKYDIFRNKGLIW